MDQAQYFKQKVTPFDLGIEWFIKGANIGMVYGLCFLADVERKAGAGALELFKDRVMFVGKNTWQTGCVLGTWWFFMKSSEVLIGKQHWGNYSVAGVVTMLIWQKSLEIPKHKLLFSVPISAALCGGLGLIILGNS